MTHPIALAIISKDGLLNPTLFLAGAACKVWRISKIRGGFLKAGQGVSACMRVSLCSRQRSGLAPDPRGHVITVNAAGPGAMRNGFIQILILAELSYASAVDPALLSALQHAWDHHLQNSNVVLALRGSQATTMDAIMQHQSPLFGRFTGPWHLQPPPFSSRRHQAAPLLLLRFP